MTSLSVRVSAKYVLSLQYVCTPRETIEFSATTCGGQKNEWMEKIIIPIIMLTFRENRRLRCNRRRPPRYNYIVTAYVRVFINGRRRAVDFYYYIANCKTEIEFVVLYDVINSADWNSLNMYAMNVLNFFSFIFLSSLNVFNNLLFFLLHTENNNNNIPNTRNDIIQSLMSVYYI